MRLPFRNTPAMVSFSKMSFVKNIHFLRQCELQNEIMSCVTVWQEGEQNFFFSLSWKKNKTALLSSQLILYTLPSILLHHDATPCMQHFSQCHIYCATLLFYSSSTFHYNAWKSLETQGKAAVRGSQRHEFNAIHWQSDNCLLMHFLDWVQADALHILMCLHLREYPPCCTSNISSWSI